MKKDISVGGQAVPCVANAFTPILYRQIFHKDFMTEMTSFSKLKGKKPSDYTDEDTATALERTQSFSRLAFVMKEQATDKTIKELVKLNELDYYEWLSKYEPSDFNDVSTITDVLTLWRGNSEDNKVTAKNA